MRLILAVLLCLASPALAQVAGLNPGPDPRLPVPSAHPPWHAVASIEAEGAGLCTGAVVAHEAQQVEVGLHRARALAVAPAAAVPTPAAATRVPEGSRRR